MSGTERDRPTADQLEKAWVRPRASGTVPRNDQGREIWFDRVLWSWMPCHWKGWALIAGVVGAAMACFWLLTWVSGEMNKPDASWPDLVFIPFVALSWWLAERHSPSRGDDR